MSLYSLSSQGDILSSNLTKSHSSKIVGFKLVWSLTVDMLQRHLLTHWGRVSHICVRKLTIIVSDNGLSPGRRQAIIWTNAGILLIRPLGTNFNEMFIKILTFSFMKMRLKVLSAKWRPFCLCLNVLNFKAIHTSWQPISWLWHFRSFCRHLTTKWISN